MVNDRKRLIMNVMNGGLVLMREEDGQYETGFVERLLGNALFWLVGRGLVGEVLSHFVGCLKFGVACD